VQYLTSATGGNPFLRTPRFSKACNMGYTLGPRDLLEPPRADFSHAALHDADLKEATICSFFFGSTKLVRARLCSKQTFLQQFTWIPILRDDIL
jgi:hypothetical protein